MLMCEGRLEVEVEVVVMQYIQCNLPQSQSAYHRSTSTSLKADDGWPCYVSSVPTWTFLLPGKILIWTLSPSVTSQWSWSWSSSSFCWTHVLQEIGITNTVIVQYYNWSREMDIKSCKIVKSNIKFLSRLNWHYKVNIYIASTEQRECIWFSLLQF